MTLSKELLGLLYECIMDKQSHTKRTDNPYKHDQLIELEGIVSKEIKK